MSFEQVIEEVMGWPTERKLALRDRLDDALEGDVDDLGISREELQGRIDEVMSGKADLISHEDVMVEARKLIGKQS